MAKVEKLPSGSYRIRVYNKFTKKQKTFVGKSAKEVKALAAQYLVAMTPDDGEDCTIKAAIRKYIDNRSSVLSPSTVAGYEKYAKLYYSDLEYISVEEVTSEQIQRLVNDLSITKSPKSVRNIYGLLVSSILAVKPHKAINVSLPAKKPSERHIPTDSDVKKLLDMASRNLRIAILLASIGTLRRGEVCAVMYEDIQGNTIHVHADMVQDKNNEWVYKDMPKNASSDRYIEFPEKVIKEIGKGSGYIVPINPNTLSQLFARLKHRAGLSCRFHDLRHYAASIMHAIGIPDVYIMERGGWSSDTVLKSIYRNALDDKSKEFSNKANEYFSKII